MNECVKQKEIHFICHSKIPEEANCSWQGTNEQILQGDERIVTTQMGCLTTRLFDLGYRIIIHESVNESYEITLGANARTDKWIQPDHNLFDLWQDGEFDKPGGRQYV